MVDIGMGLPARSLKKDRLEQDDVPFSGGTRLAIIFGSAFATWGVVIGAAILAFQVF
jgi:hypothetical protein